MPVIVLVADGARVDALSGDLPDLPALRRLRDEGGGLHVVTSAFPSVTGPAYAPFLVGRFPGNVGTPGIRWFDRARSATSWPGWSRSYVGVELSKVNTDLDAQSPTMFELVPNSVGAMSVITRGLEPHRMHGTLTVRSAMRVAATHFSGRVDRWLDIDREVHDTVTRVIREERPDFVFAAMVGVDKGSHARGSGSALVHEALRLVDATAARIRLDAEAGGRWDSTHLWIVSDHGHSDVHAHEDLVGVLTAAGLRTIAHPWPFAYKPDAAVMVSGNAMAHVYVALGDRERRFWNALRERWGTLAERLLHLPATDLMLLPLGDGECLVRHATRGDALVSQRGLAYRYARLGGDPLDVGHDLHGSADETWAALRQGNYPDALVQIMSIAGAERAGDVILSASPGWDFRANFEPIPHVSAHGALHRDHMLVPLITNRVPSRSPRRTVDVFASALDALHVPSPANVDGRSFI